MLKRTLTILLITTLYALIAFTAAWWSIGESAERCAFTDTGRVYQVCR